MSGYAEEYKELVGWTVKAVRSMTDEELEAFGWHGVYAERACVIELGKRSPGTSRWLTNKSYTVVPSADPEGNAPGVLMVQQWPYAVEVS